MLWSPEDCQNSPNSRCGNSPEIYIYIICFSCTKLILPTLPFCLLPSIKVWIFVQIFKSLTSKISTKICKPTWTRNFSYSGRLNTCCTKQDSRRRFQTRCVFIFLWLYVFHYYASMHKICSFYVIIPLRVVEMQIS